MKGVGNKGSKDKRQNKKEETELRQNITVKEVRMKAQRDEVKTKGRTDEGS